MSRPNLEYYRKLAKDLHRGYSRGDDDAWRRFINYHPNIKRPVTDASPPPMQLADAQLVVAREARFKTWAALKRYVESFGDLDGLQQQFESAVDAVVAGDETALRTLLATSPELIAARSSREHGATLLHYSGANGVEDHRQKTPANAVAIADVLIARGADINATAGFYGEGAGSTPLVGLVTSAHPAAAGLMDDLVRAFARSGQNLNGLGDDGLPMIYAFQFRYPSAARTLAECGARVDHIATAAGLGRLDAVRDLVDDSTPPGADPGALEAAWGDKYTRQRAVEQALHFAAIAGETEVVRFLLDRGVDVNAALRHDLTALHEAAWCGRLDTVRLLVERGASLDAREKLFDGTPHGWAAHGEHAEVARFLLEAGA